MIPAISNRSSLRPQTNTRPPSLENVASDLERWVSQQNEVSPIGYDKAIERFKFFCDKLKAADQTPADHDPVPGSVALENSEMSAKLQTKNGIHTLEYEDKPVSGLAYLGELLHLKPKRFQGENQPMEYSATLHSDLGIISVFDKLPPSEGGPRSELYSIFTKDQTIHDYRQSY